MSEERFLWDVHTHSNCSDALEYDPEEVVEKAKEIGVDFLSLNDHDTTSGCERAIQAAEGSKVLVIPGGVEVTTMHVDDMTGSEGIEIHLLGYGINELEKLDDFLAPTREVRKERIDNILKIYRHVHAHEIQLRSRESATRTRESIRQSIADEELRREFMKDTSWGQTGWIPYREGGLMPTGVALDKLKEYCKLRILAHPGRLIQQYELRLKNKFFPDLAKKGGIEYSVQRLQQIEEEFEVRAVQDAQFAQTYNQTRRIIGDQLYTRSVDMAINLVETHQLNGFELYYPDHTPEMVRMIQRVIRRINKRYDKDLIITLGSDFGHKDKEMATGKSNNLVPYQNKSDAEKFLQASDLKL